MGFFMNTLSSNKISTYLLAAVCLAFCLLHSPDLPHIDQAPAFEKAHLQEIVETDQFIKEIEENNYVFINDKRRNLVKIKFSPV
jgi:hypothetical protein